MPHYTVEVKRRVSKKAPVTVTYRHPAAGRFLSKKTKSLCLFKDFVLKKKTPKRFIVRASDGMPDYMSYYCAFLDLLGGS